MVRSHLELNVIEPGQTLNDLSSWTKGNARCLLKQAQTLYVSLTDIVWVHKHQLLRGLSGHMLPIGDSQTANIISTVLNSL